MDEKLYKTDFLVAQPSFLSGAGRIFDLFGTFDDYNDSSSPAEADARAMNNDWNMILQDFRGTVDAAKVRIENGEAGQTEAKRAAKSAPRDELISGMSISGTYEERRYISELPDPDDLAKIEGLRNGAVDIILEQYKRQAEHRRNMEEKVVEGNVRQQNRGPLYGMVLVLAALGCGTYLEGIWKRSHGRGVELWNDETKLQQRSE